MHAVQVLLRSVGFWYWLISPCSSGLLHWHKRNHAIAQIAVNKPKKYEYINHVSYKLTKPKQSKTKPFAYLMDKENVAWQSFWYSFIRVKSRHLIWNRIPDGHNFAHATTAQLLWHVQSCDLRVADHKMSCDNLTKWMGTSLAATMMATRGSLY